MIDLKTLIKVLALGAIIASVVILIVIKKFKSDITEYPELVKEELWYGTVIYKNDYQGVLYLELTNNTKRRIGYSINYDYNNYRLNKFISVGDSIFKGRKTDTLLVYKNGMEYYFILNQIINE